MLQKFFSPDSVQYLGSKASGVFLWFMNQATAPIP
jgi:hypothetical protein